jgi:signal transduction histidine kinase
LILLGGTIYGIIPTIIYLVGLNPFFPGINGICLSIGMFVIVLSFRKCPELHTVLLISSNEAKRRYLMDRLFFHDFLNTLSTLNSSVEILKEYSKLVDKEQYLSLIETGVVKLLDEIQLHRDLYLVESGNLVINPVDIQTMDLLKELDDSYSSVSMLENKHLVISPDSVDINLLSDKILIHRILSNMIKNAIEAIKENETVTIGCSETQKQVILWVHNPGVIPHDIQKSIFTDHITTKGGTRGYGTYSMKLLTDQLYGEIDFTTSENDGTRFFLRIPQFI